MRIGPQIVISKFASLSRPFKFLTFLFICSLIIIPVVLYSQKGKQGSGLSEIQSITAKLSKIVDVPSGTPTVATVSDITKLKGQPFFANAQNGDKVIIYANARKAYLYRPSTDKLIDVATYNPPAPSQEVAGAATSPTPTISPTPQVFLPTSTPTPFVGPSNSPTPTEITPTKSLPSNQ